MPAIIANFGINQTINKKLHTKYHKSNNTVRFYYVQAFFPEYIIEFTGFQII